MEDYSEQFKVTAQYPQRDEVKNKVSADILSRVNKDINVESVNHLKSIIDKEAEKEYKRLLDEYKVEQSMRYESFKKVALIDAGFNNYPEEIKDLVFSKAWEEGHAYGYNEVYIHLVDLYDFVEKIIKYYNKK